jgi:hypothetical protein
VLVGMGCRCTWSEYVPQTAKAHTQGSVFYINMGRVLIACVAFLGSVFICVAAPFLCCE